MPMYTLPGWYMSRYTLPGGKPFPLALPGGKPFPLALPGGICPGYTSLVVYAQVTPPWW